MTELIKHNTIIYLTSSRSKVDNTYKDILF